MRTLLLHLMMAVTLTAGCARTARRTPISLEVVDDLTGAPVEAIMVVRTLDPRHPLSVADLLRPSASSRRTYIASRGRISGTFDATLEQAELLARGYEPMLLSGEDLIAGVPPQVRLRPSGREQPVRP